MSDEIQKPTTTTTGVTSAVIVAEPTYIVLRAGAEGTWNVVKEVKASSADAAIKEAAGEKEGKYVAVPARSWNPRTVEVKTEKRTVLS